MRRLAEGGSRSFQVALYGFYERVPATHHAPRDPNRVFDRCHGLAEIVERGAFPPAEQLRVHPPHPERDFMILSENTSCHGHRFAHQCLGFFEAL